MIHELPLERRFLHGFFSRALAGPIVTQVVNQAVGVHVRDDPFT